MNDEQKTAEIRRICEALQSANTAGAVAALRAFHSLATPSAVLALLSEREASAARIAALEALLKEAGEALEPFARKAIGSGCFSDSTGAFVDLGHCRAARAVAEKLKGAGA
jgi:hypothetical protein